MMIGRPPFRATIFCGAAVSLAALGMAQTTAEDHFESKIRPILADHCYACHSAQATPLEGGLRLDTNQGRSNGGNSGPVIVPGDPAQSLLFRAVSREESVAAMPPDEPLDPATVEILRAWIESGAVATPDSTDMNMSLSVSRSPSGHWAFRAPTRPEIPSDDFGGWARTDLDRLVAGRLRERGLAPSPDAPPGILVRRLYFDLLGLPPSAEDLERFAESPSDEAYSALVERLLAMPQYGERWARYWLDVARYADTKGYVFTEDRNYPNAYKYRDWVIHALNADMPYDEFIKMQLAADLIAPEKPESWVALGFLTLGRRFLNNPQDIIDDRIDVTCRGLLGLTVACARCHDHKYDPIPTADYYSLHGVFASSQEKTEDFPVLHDAPQPVDSPILVRGNAGNRGRMVPRRFVSVIAGPEAPAFQRGSGRLELAEAITATTNPLTARVFVNRVWGHLFGDYWVGTPSDFGVRSDPPENLAALDYLACRFQESGGSLKQLLTDIVTSSVYRQSSAVAGTALAVDPLNRMFGRQNRRRLDFESLRDAMLLVSGRLDLEPIGGPSVDIEKAPYPRRRSLYAAIDRQNVAPLFRTFDVASADLHAPRRWNTIVPQQALFLMNSVWALELADALGGEPRDALAISPEQRVTRLFRRVLSRSPTPEELAAAIHFVTSNSAISAESSQKQWRELAQVLLMSNEFATVD